VHRYFDFLVKITLFYVASCRINISSSIINYQILYCIKCHLLLITHQLVLIPSAVIRETSTVSSWIENLKVFHSFVIQPYSLQNGSGLTKRISSRTVFHIRLPRSGELVAVFELENPFSVFFIVYPITFSVVVCDKQKSSFRCKSSLQIKCKCCMYK